MSKKHGVPSAKKPNKNARVYWVSFDTRDPSGYVRGTKITIEQDVIFEMETARIDLADDPLYSDLQRYVTNNPRAEKA